MSNICGHCAYYVKRHDCEDVCSKTGKITPYMDKKDCFAEDRERNDRTAHTLVPGKPIRNKPTAPQKKKRGVDVNASLTDKVCSKCKRRLPIENFYVDKYSYNGYRSQCKECTKESHRERYKELKELKHDHNNTCDN